jgi:hypothetical protein
MAHHGVDAPERRPLRVFALDPMKGRGRLSTVTIDVENEVLTPGPRGKRVRVVDYDASRKCFYEPVDLDDRHLLMQGGLEPSEGDPRFHQQMVYAVAMKVIENFDRALGRRITFRNPRNPRDRSLLLVPHAFRKANAYFDPRIGGVCFGYFTADPENPGENLPGQNVFTCLSQDIIAHEVTHAVTHRMREYFMYPSNDDVLAFHEGFADIVAIFQHFTFPAVLSDAVASTQGELRGRETFVGLASQFGHATGKRGALRTALDHPDPSRYRDGSEQHDRGSILVAAVFDAFMEIYNARARDLIRIATGGLGILPKGDLHPDLVERLAREASRAAQDVLTMCIRAFEYLPPVDVTFGDYLRALITADHDLVAEAGVDARREMIAAFRRRGIFPENVISLSEDALRWEPAPPDMEPMPSESLAESLVAGARRRRGPEDEGDEKSVFTRLRGWAERNAEALGLRQKGRIGVHGFHATFRVNPRGSLVVEVVAQFVQKRDTTGEPAFGGVPFLSGATVVAEADGTIRFVIAKPATTERRDRQTAFVSRLDLRNPALPWLEGADRNLRARTSFRDLHRGLVG